MRKVLLIALCAMTASGCFFGGEGDTSTKPAEKEDSLVVVPKTKSISPGVYVGDYTWIDSNKAELESELELKSNGAFRQFWIQGNVAQFEIHGKWAQHDSNLHLIGVNEGYGDRGFFSDYTKAEDDTNSIRGISDTSFIRREYTPLRQKPYWITFTKRSYPTLKDGSYEVKQFYPSLVDSLDSVEVKYKIKLKGDSFLYSYSEDTLELFQSDAKWYQIGSFFATENNRSRELDDSTKTFSDWTSPSGLVLSRLRLISDTAFQMWIAPQGFDSGTWDDYRRSP